VYAVADEAGTVRFVGISRNLAVSLAAHASALPDRVSAVRTHTFKDASRPAMEQLKRAWIAELGYTPDGNSEDARRWADSIRASVGTAEAAEAAAVPTAPTTPTMPTPPTASPFSEEAPKAPSGGEGGLELTVSNVDKVLDEVRPYLVADGGNVAVASVDDDTRSVYLVLEGACGSCPSSTVTMKMGIERVLREKFVDLGEVAAVEPVAEESKPLTIEMVEETLQPIMPAIRGLGGSVEVLSAAGGVVKLCYQGPAKIRFGIDLALKDNPAITSVEFVEAEGEAA